MNSFSVCGNLTQDPKCFGDDPDKPTMVVYTIAENTWTKKRGKHTVFWSVACFGRAAARAIKVATKGTKAHIMQGRLDEEEFTDRGGAQRRAFQITAIEVDYSGKFRQTTEQAERSGAQRDDWGREESPPVFDGLDDGPGF